MVFSSLSASSSRQTSRQMAPNIPKKKPKKEIQAKIPFKKKKSSVIYSPSMVEFELDQPTKTYFPVLEVKHFIDCLECLIKSRKSCLGDNFDLSHVRVHELISLSNKVFGFNGWKTKIIQNPQVRSSDVTVTQVNNEDYFARLKQVKKEKEEEEERKEEPSESLTVKSLYTVEMDASVELHIRHITTTANCKVKVVNLPRERAYQLAKKESVTASLKQCFHNILQQGSQRISRQSQAHEI